SRGTRKRNIFRIILDIPPGISILRGIPRIPPDISISIGLVRKRSILRGILHIPLGISILRGFPHIPPNIGLGILIGIKIDQLTSSSSSTYKRKSPSKRQARCFNCGGIGHFAHDCPSKRRSCRCRKKFHNKHFGAVAFVKLGQFLPPGFEEDCWKKNLFSFENREKFEKIAFIGSAGIRGQSKRRESVSMGFLVKFKDSRVKTLIQRS
ncbi:hypothetical protein KI387_012200, partial [Taxus chinensis]